MRSRSGESRIPLTRRPSSLAASDNDVYTKSNDDNNSIAAKSRNDMDAISVNGPAAWSTTFEKLLADPAGLHTFSVSYFFV